MILGVTGNFQFKNHINTMTQLNFSYTLKSQKNNKIVRYYCTIKCKFHYNTCDKENLDYLHLWLQKVGFCSNFLKKLNQNFMKTTYILTCDMLTNSFQSEMSSRNSDVSNTPRLLCWRKFELIYFPIRSLLQFNQKIYFCTNQNKWEGEIHSIKGSHWKKRVLQLLSGFWRSGTQMELSE